MNAIIVSIDNATTALTDCSLTEMWAEAHAAEGVSNLVIDVRSREARKVVSCPVATAAVPAYLDELTSGLRRAMVMPSGAIQITETVGGLDVRLLDAEGHPLDVGQIARAKT